MKILYVNSLYPPDTGGGAELVLQSQADAMARRGHEVTVLTIGAQAEDLASERQGSVAVLRARYRNRYFHFNADRSAGEKLLWHVKDSNNPAMGAQAAQVARSVRPEVACLHNLAGWSVAIWGELQRLGIPVVQVLHDQYLLCAKSTMFRSGANCAGQCLDCRLLRLRHRRASNQVAGVIGVSRFILERILAAGFFSTVALREVIHNVSAGGMPQLPPARDLRAEPVTRLGFIGGLTESKGIRFLLDTWRDLDLPRLTLCVAGRGEPDFVNRLRAQYAGCRVEFLGYTPPDDFFRAVDVTIVPSLWNDTYPGVVLESLGHGVPVNASRRGGIPEMVRDGCDGWLFDPAEPGSLAAILRAIAAHPESVSAAAAQCRRDAAKRYDMTAWVEAEEAFLERCAPAASARPVSGRRPPGVRAS